MFKECILCILNISNILIIGINDIKKYNKVYLLIYLDFNT